MRARTDVKRYLKFSDVSEEDLPAAPVHPAQVSSKPAQQNPSKKTTVPVAGKRKAQALNEEDAYDSGSDSSSSAEESSSSSSESEYSDNKSDED